MKTQAIICVYTQAIISVTFLLIFKEKMLYWK